MEKVVKCTKCGQYFMHTEKDITCPFCYTEYTEDKVETKEKKETPKTRKESFKMWKDDAKETT